jgi:GNAT superfamily N-acetyltransferase
MLIRRAGLDDMDAAARLFDAYRQFYGQRSDVAAARAFLTERLRRDESVVFLAVAGEPAGEAVGFMQLYPSFTSVSLGRVWILNDLFVDPGVRRGGVGRRLLEQARDWAVETQAKGLILSTALTNKAAQSLYEACGWVHDDEFQHYRLVV